MICVFPEKCFYFALESHVKLWFLAAPAKSWIKAVQGSTDFFHCKFSIGAPWCFSSSVVFSPGRQLISCSEDGSVRIWELREKQQLAAEPVPTGVCVFS